MAGDEPETLRKRRTSPVDGADEGSKRRKHSHHRHHHSSGSGHQKRHHRHRSSKHDRDRKHEQDEIDLPVVVSSSNSRPDYDKEEGEIVEEEEDNGVGNGEVLKKKPDSDVESGEINPDEVVEKLENLDQGGHDEGDTFSGKAQEEFVLNVNLSLENRNDVDMGMNASVDAREKTNYQFLDVKKVHDEADIPRDSRTECLVSNGKEYRMGETDGSSAEFESSKSMEKKVKRRHNVSSARDSTLNCDNGDIGHKSLKGDKGLHSGSQSPLKGSGKERNYRDVEAHVSRRHHRSRSPVSRGDAGSRKHRKTDDREGKTDTPRNVEEHNLVRYESKESSESMDTGRSGSGHEKKLVASENTKDQYKTKPCSPSRECNHDEVHTRNRSKSRDRGRERSRSRSVLQDGPLVKTVHYHEKETKSYTEISDRVKPFDSLDKAKDDSDCEKVVRHNRENRHSSRDWVRDKERERNRYNDPRRLKHDQPDYLRDRRRTKDPARVPSSENDYSGGGKDKVKRDNDEQEDYQERVTLQLAEQEEEDLDRIKEESRKRREAILEKYKQQQLPQKNELHSEDPGKEEKPAEQPCPPKAAVNVVPEVFEGRIDSSDVYVAEPLFSVGKSPPQNETSAFERTSDAGGLGDGTPKSERSADMFCDDIFGESPAGVRKSGKGGGLQIERSGLHDNWDDAEGYYSKCLRNRFPFPFLSSDAGYRFGEVLDGRYEVTAAHGKGVFSTVVRAKDLKAGKDDPEEVAVKIIRNNDTMYKAGLEELVILKKLAGADPEDRRHCVRFLSSFKYRNHLCLVFESLHMNLREVLKKFGRNIGLKLTAVRAYAKQLFIALKHLRNCGVLHCDIKPDNMLVNEAKNVLKLCDFGNAMFAGKNEITPYLVSRFYRAPEIILGLSYDHPMDIWSVGCCLYEIYSGKVLFPGPSNNDMLRLHMELKGPFPKKMLRKGAFTELHFDQDLNFHATEEDPVTKKTIKRLLLNIRPKDIGTIIASSLGEDPKMLANFKDLLERIFVLDPEKRMTVSQALSHPFITGK
ncbi:hypothetical protein HHK36_029805 [Tetracentron sinense]|uniref:non-specific serine/threonine protein kinase n=1 Tax=Tetracentron sinense TaxID=13715 RepID=A0A834YFX1_TETSI|nr:hypothetical protein HHK36_029805 [Tetracentron sinense]